MSNYDDSNNVIENTSEEVTHRSRTKKKRGEASSSKKRTGSAKKRKKRSEETNVEVAENNSSKSKKKKKKALKIAICVILALILAVIVYVAVIIINAPDIETDNIYSLLSQSSVLYDDEGNIIDTAYGDQNRTIVEISQIPEHTQNAFIALEDKTFRTHHGFNIIRIFGAIKDAVFSGGGVSGTSTITQQLARNLYLEDKMFERSLNRKITEAYYAIILEQKLEKDEILEAYLNTINFGCGFGIQTAAQAYFSKDVEELTIAESAALAAIPQMPSEFALIQTVSANEVTEDTPNLITKNGDYAYLWNDSCKNRMATCLSLMLEQGYITEEEYEEASQVEIKDIVNPNIDALNTVSNYFADYTIQTVINDLMEENSYSYEEASELVYNGGLQIYTTMDSQAQEVIENEFDDNSNYPSITGYSKDSNGDITGPNGNKLYAYSNYINDDGKFVLTSDEYKKNDDGSMTVYAGKRLNIYDTTVQGQTDYSVEFKDMYLFEDNTLYTINGGYLNIPQNYKTKDSDGNLVISAAFFEDYPTFFEETDSGLATDQYSLNQRVIQPQSAMVIIDNATGQIKAMSGGRKTTSRMLFNRATSDRQPGSSIKPLSVYSAALQKSFELQQDGKTFDIADNGYDQQGAELWGEYITAASIVDDEPTTINGKVWPKNSYSGYSGLYTFRRALQQSVNVCAVKILSQVGVDYSANLLEKYGITSVTDDDLNLAALGLGGMASGISPLEMASAYSTFVNDGTHISPTIYTKVTNRNGDTILEASSEETQVLDEGVAWIMRDLLRTVVTEGIGYPAAISGTTVGGKTGTTDRKDNIWFCGFTPKYSAALWIGNDYNLNLSSDSYAASSMWSKIMRQVENAQGGSYSERPDNVVQVKIDTKSGLLATDASGSDVRNEYFTSGTQPTEEDNVHQTVDICADSGYLATPSCTNVTSKSGIMRPYIPSDSVRDKSSELPHYYCNLHNPDPDSYPTEPGKSVTIVETPPALPPEDENEGGDTGDNGDTGDTGNNGEDSGNTGDTGDTGGSTGDSGNTGSGETGSASGN